MSANRDVAGKPSQRAGADRSWIERLRLHAWPGRLALLLVLMVPAWATEKSLFTWSRQKSVRQTLDGFRSTGRQFGEPIGIAFIAVAVWTLDRTNRPQLARLILAVLIAGAIAAGLKPVAGRERPKVTAGETVWRGPHWPGTMHPDASFPSGHTAAAFALAYGLAQLYPHGRGAFLFFAAACGASRALAGQHFLTDVVVGAWLGWEVASRVWNSTRLDAIRNRMQARLWRPRPDRAPTPTPLRLISTDGQGGYRDVALRSRD